MCKILQFPKQKQEHNATTTSNEAQKTVIPASSFLLNKEIINRINLNMKLGKEIQKQQGKRNGK